MQDQFALITISISPKRINPLNSRISIHPYSYRTRSGDDKHHSRQSHGVNEKVIIMYTNAIRVVQIQIYLDPWMISDESINLSQMIILESKE